MFRNILLLMAVLILFLARNGSTQQIGLLPPSVKWQQIRDDSLRIIYPQGEEERAKRVAALMLKLASVDPITKTGRYRPISVLLQPQTNISNGYVGLAPYVSEFYLSANENPFALGSLPWHDLLAIHEYRHVQQINAANRSFTHVIKACLGELAFSGLYSLAVPNWYREGDAVYAETKWTMQGRGRLSGFTLPFHEKLVQGVTWNYYKLRNGSYRSFIPDHYSLGYLLVQFGNHVFGESTWDTILQKAPAYKHLFSPFSGTMKDTYGKKNKLFYLDAMEWYAGIWEAAHKDKDIIYPLIPMSQKDKKDDYYDMAYPDVSEDGSIYAAVSTFDYTKAIYRIDPDGQQKRIVSMGLQQDPNFDYENHRLVWTELRYDPRWIRKDKSVIVVFDEETGKKMSIVPRKGFFTPSLDNKGERIVALHVDLDGNNHLQILDARNGSLLATLPNPDNLYLGHPIWSEDELSIIATARDDQGRMALVEEDIATGEIKNITHYSYNVLGRPSLHENWIFLTTSLDDQDQVYAVDRHEGIFYRVSRGSTAHYDPVWDPKQNLIICSEYRLNGKKLVRVPGLPSKDWKLTGLDDGVKKIDGAAENLLAPAVDERTYESKKYSPWNGAINFHSLTLTLNDPNIGVEIRSVNIMNNIAIAGGYAYNANSQALGPYANIKFGMWYPVFSFGVSQVGRNETSNDQNYKIKNGQINAGISIPLLFTPGIFSQAVIVSSTYHTGNSKETPTIDDDVDYNYKFNYITNRIVLINARNRAFRQTIPTWAQRLDFTYTHELSGIHVSQFYLSGTLSFPGIKPSHYLIPQAEFFSQDISPGALLLSSSYSGARGFPTTDGERQYHFGFTYGFPIWYPDIGFGSILFMRRIRLQPFFDIAHTDAVEAPAEWMRSAGLEMVFDVKFPPVTFGFRFSKLLAGYTGNSNVFEFYIPLIQF